MKTAFLIEPCKIELRDVPIPSPSKGELLIKISSALTCGTDKKAFLRGHPMIPMPGPFGHEFSGIVAAIGRGVEGFREGDEVMAVHSAPCEACWYCRKGIFSQCETIMQEKVLGAFSEYITLPRHIVRKNTFIKPTVLSFDEAAMLEPLACVLHGMAGLDLKMDGHAVVIGYGPIALLHILVLRQRGLWVTAVGRESEKLATAQDFGANETVLLADAGNASIRADVVFECTGAEAVWELTPYLVRRGGTVILFGGCKKGTTVTFDTYRLHYEEITLRGVFHFTPEDVREAYRLMSEGLSLRGLITASYRLTEIEEVFKLLREGKGLKYALKP